VTKNFKNYGLIILIITFLSACGNQVCVMGFGKCEAPEKPITPAPANLTLTPSKTTLAVTEQITLTIAGGTANYKMEFVGTALGTLTATGATAGSFSSVTTWTYTAPNQTGTDTIKVTDQSNPAKTVSVALTIQ